MIMTKLFSHNYDVVNCWGISVSQMTMDISFVITIRSFSHSWLITGFLTWVPLVFFPFFSRFHWYTQTQTCATWGHTSTYIQIQITEWVSRQAKEHNTNIEIRITYSAAILLNSFTLHSDNMPPILFILLLGVRW